MSPFSAKWKCTLGEARGDGMDGDIRMRKKELSRLAFGTV